MLTRFSTDVSAYASLRAMCRSNPSNEVWKNSLLSFRLLNFTNIRNLYWPSCHLIRFLHLSGQMHLSNSKLSPCQCFVFLMVFDWHFCLNTPGSKLDFFFIHMKITHRFISKHMGHYSLKFWQATGNGDLRIFYESSFNCNEM